MSDESIVAQAIAYLDLGLSVIPVSHEKRALVPWEKFQKIKATKKEILQWYIEFKQANVAIVTGKLSRLIVVDIDDPKMEDEVRRLLPAGCNPPSALTPRGGKHLYFRYPDTEVRNTTGLLPKVDIRAEGGYVVSPPSRNGISRPYAWIKGHSIFDISPPPFPDAIYNILNSFNAYIGVSLTKTTIDTTRRQLTTLDFREGMRDETLFHIANCLIKGGMAKDNATYLLENIAVKFCEAGTKPYTVAEAKAKVQSAIDRAMRREKGTMEEMREWVMTTNGVFLTTEVHKDLDLTTKDDKKKAAKYLLRLVDEGLIEKSGTKRGCYRTVEKSYEVMDFLGAPDEEFDVDLPLDLNSRARIYPGNIIIVAGSKSAGKTAFMLNLVRNNMDKHKIYYMNSEMGESELKKRLSRFEDVGLKDWKFIPIARNSNWEDLITDEKAIFIIDYMEPPADKPYMVAEHIKNIHFKLKNGICFIALQKVPGRDTGRGDYYTLEKCRVALALDYVPDTKRHKAKIVECKSPKGDNPRGQYMQFDCRGGYCKPDGMWRW